MSDAAGLVPGGRVGDYTLVQKLRDGGMASLFLAKRTGAHGFTRPVAIKIVHTHLSGQAEFVQMFVDEALLSSHLSHPNIVHVEE
ncbi:MAG: serine/threonine protein kinase, partial [Polyangiales bacterium]